GAADADLEVEVRPARVPGRPDRADADALRDEDADADVDPRQVRVHSPLAVPVGDRDEEAPPALAPPGVHDLAAARGEDGGSRRGRKVDPRVETVAARTEPVAEDRRRHRPSQR